MPGNNFSQFGEDVSVNILKAVRALLLNQNFAVPFAGKNSKAALTLAYVGSPVSQ